MGYEKSDSIHAQSNGLKVQSQVINSTVDHIPTIHDKEPDGLFGNDGFRFAGWEVHFNRARLQYQLIIALWDTDKQYVHEPQDIQVVIDKVYGEANDTSDSTFRQLCSDVRRKLESHHIPLTIPQPAGGKLQLSKL